MTSPSISSSSHPIFISPFVFNHPTNLSAAEVTYVVDSGIRSQNGLSTRIQNSPITSPLMCSPPLMIIQPPNKLIFDPQIQGSGMSIVGVTSQPFGVTSQYGAVYSEPIVVTQSSRTTDENGSKTMKLPLTKAVEDYEETSNDRKFSKPLRGKTIHSSSKRKSEHPHKITKVDGCPDGGESSKKDESPVVSSQTVEENTKEAVPTLPFEVDPPEPDPVEEKERIIERSPSSGMENGSEEGMSIQKEKTISRGRGRPRKYFTYLESSDVIAEGGQHQNIPFIARSYCKRGRDGPDTMEHDEKYIQFRRANNIAVRRARENKKRIQQERDEELLKVRSERDLLKAQLTSKSEEVVKMKKELDLLLQEFQERGNKFHTA